MKRFSKALIAGMVCLSAVALVLLALATWIISAPDVSFHPWGRTGKISLTIKWSNSSELSVDYSSSVTYEQLIGKANETALSQIVITGSDNGTYRLDSNVSLDSRVKLSNGIENNLSSTETAVGNTYLATNYSFDLGEIQVQVGDAQDDNWKDVSKTDYEWSNDVQHSGTTATLSDRLLKYKTVQIGSTYYTIEDALNSSTSGTSRNPTIIRVQQGQTSFTGKSVADLADYSTSSFYTVKNYVTLALPYDGTNTYGSPGAEATATDTLSFGDADKQKLLLTIPQDLTLTNNGTIEVGGYVTGSGAGCMAGQTSENYARIDLGSRAKIDSNGDIKVYGFITESTPNNASEVIMHSGSMSMPFVVVEHRGGSCFSNFKNDLSGSPFNRFFMHNVSAKLTFEANSNLYGSAKLKTDKKTVLFVPLPAQENATEIHLIGNNSSALIQLNTNAKVVAKLQANSFTTGEAKSPVKLDTYGSCTLNTMSLSVHVPVVGNVDVSTKGVLFPISWYWQIALHPFEGGNPATVDATPQDLKLLPGGVLTVEQNVTLKANKVAVYKEDSWTDAGVSMGENKLYETGKGDGQFTVNGAFECQEFGGTIQNAANQNATVIITKSVNLISKELKASTGNGAEGGSLTWDNINLSLDFVSGVPQGANTYTYLDGAWRSNSSYTVVYHLSGGNVSGSTSDITMPVTENIMYGLLYKDWLNNAPAPSVTRTHYTFGEWALSDGTPVIDADGMLTNSDVTVTGGGQLDLYAVWTPKEYTITYDTSRYESGAETSGEVNNGNPNTFNIESNIPLQEPQDGDLVFDSWYLDSRFETPVTAINGAEILKDVNSDDYARLTLYGRWYPAGTEFYTVKYHYNKPDEYTDSTVTVVSSNAGSWAPLALDGRNSDPMYEDFFAGWYTDSAFENPFDGTLSGDTDLYAKWENKIQVIFKAEEVNGVAYEYSAGWYYDSATITVPDKNTMEFTEYYNVVYFADDDDVTKEQYFYGWTVNNGTPIPAGGTYNFNEADADGNIITLTVSMENKVTLTAISLSHASVSASVSANEYSCEPNKPLYFKPGTSITVKAKYDENDKHKLTIDPDTGVTGDDNSKTFTINENRTISASSDTCIVEGTLIMMADGTQKPVEEVKAGDEILVFNHETGKYEASKVWFNDHDPRAWYTIIRLKFSDGSEIGISYRHGFFDLDLNKYVLIDEMNYHEFIGHRFTSVKQVNGEFVSGEVTLVSGSVAQEYIRVFSPLSEYHFNIVTDGVLSMANFLYGETGFFNFFEFGEGMKYDEEKMQADIEQYGLFTYEEFADLITYDIWCKAPVQYLKISIGKGLMTFEDIELTVQWLIDKGFFE